MNKHLQIVKSGGRNAKQLEFKTINPEDPRSYSDHCSLIDQYLKSHRVRNHSVNTIKKEEAFLLSWFKEHGTLDRQLYFWEAMEPVVGRKRVLDYCNALIDSGLTSSTVRAYSGILSRFFSYVLEHPYVGQGDSIERINLRYGSIEHPVSEFDIPKHAYDGEKMGIPFDPEKLYDFYSIVRDKYLIEGRNKSVRARNYAMVVLAGESGLRVDELLHLELVDLFFESHKLQTRFAKGTRGSGKRARITLFPPLARDSLKYYINSHRTHFIEKNESTLVFPSKTGKALSYTSVHLALKDMVDFANKNNFPVAEHMSFHWLRRFFATRFIERFPNQLSVLVELLGHMTPNTVHRYIRHSEAWMDEKILEMLEKGGSSWPLIGT